MKTVRHRYKRANARRRNSRLRFTVLPQVVVNRKRKYMLWSDIGQGYIRGDGSITQIPLYAKTFGGYHVSLAIHDAKINSDLTDWRPIKK